MQALEGKNADAVSSFRPISARLEIIANLNTQELTELDEAKIEITKYIIGYYSQVRPHQHNADLSPNEIRTIILDEL